MEYIVTFGMIGECNPSHKLHCLPYNVVRFGILIAKLFAETSTVGNSVVGTRNTKLGVLRSYLGG